MNKKKNEAPLGDMGPIIELVGLGAIKLCELFAKGLFYVFQRFAVAPIQTRLGILHVEPVKKIERKDLGCKKRIHSNDALGYSVNHKRKFKNSELDKTKHTVIIGASGAGKTVTFETLLQADLREGKSIVFIDPKGDNELLEKFVGLCRLYERDYRVFSKHCETENPIKLNPVKEGTYTEISDRLFASFTWSEEYYAAQSKRGLKEAVKYLQKSSLPVTLKSIYDTLEILSTPKERRPAFIKKEDIQGLLTRLDNIVDSDFGELICGDGALSLHEVRKTNQCVYIGLSKVKYPETCEAVGKLFLGDMNYSIGEIYEKISWQNKAKLNPLGFYVDELASIITKQFIYTLSMCRGSKVEVTTGFQSLADITKINPELCQQVLENTLNWFVMKQRVKEAASFLAESIGTIESTKKTVRIENGEEQDFGSQRSVEELIVHSNIIKNLGVGQCVLLRQQPTKVDLLNLKFIPPSSIENNLKLLEGYELINKKKELEKIKREAESKDNKPGLVKC